MSDLRKTDQFRPGSAADIRNRAAAWIVKRKDHECWTDADQAELNGSWRRHPLTRSPICVSKRLGNVPTGWARCAVRHRRAAVLFRF